MNTQRQKVTVAEMLQIVQKDCKEQGFLFSQGKTDLRTIWYVTVPYKGETYNFESYDPEDFINLMFTSTGSSAGASFPIARDDLYPILKSLWNKYKIVAKTVKAKTTKPLLKVTLTKTDVEILQNIFEEAGLYNFIDSNGEEEIDEVYQLFTKLGVVI